MSFVLYGTAKPMRVSLVEPVDYLLGIYLTIGLISKTGIPESREATMAIMPMTINIPIVRINISVI